MKLEKALGTNGPVVDCLKEELEKARNTAKRRLQQEVEEPLVHHSVEKASPSWMQNDYQRWRHSTRRKNVWCSWKPSRQKSQRCRVQRLREELTRVRGVVRVSAHHSQDVNGGHQKTFGAPRCDGVWGQKVWDKKSILAVTDLMQQGVRKCHNLPSIMTNMVV